MSIANAIRDSQERFAKRPPAQLFEGTVSTAPAALGEPMRIVADSFGDGLHYFDPVAWPERGTLLPSVGDRVLFAFSNLGNTWVIDWWPYD